MTSDQYANLVAGISAWIAVAALWLSGMMLARVLTTRRATQIPDLASLIYATSTFLVFGIIALRSGDHAPEWLVILILLAKAVATTVIACWVWTRMRQEHIP